MAIKWQEDATTKLSTNALQIWEVDATKQSADFEIVSQFMANLTSGDVLRLQFASDATTVYLVSDATYGDHADSAAINIMRIN